LTWRKRRSVSFGFPSSGLGLKARLRLVRSALKVRVSSNGRPDGSALVIIVVIVDRLSVRLLRHGLQIARTRRQCREQKDDDHETHGIPQAKLSTRGNLTLP
jgi:hypothetical protein